MNKSQIHESLFQQYEEIYFGTKGRELGPQRTGTSLAAHKLPDYINYICAKIKESSTHTVYIPLFYEAHMNYQIELFNKQRNSSGSF